MHSLFQKSLQVRHQVLLVMLVLIWAAEDPVWRLVNRDSHFMVYDRLIVCIYIYKSYIRYCGINILGCIKRYFTAHVPQQNPLSCSSALRGQPWIMAAFTLVAYRVVTRLPKRSPHWEPLVGDRSCLRWQWSPAQRREGNDKPAMTGNDLYHL